MITNSDPGYFRALVEFERDSLPPPRPASEVDAVSGDLQRLSPRATGAARSSTFRIPSGEGRDRGHLFNFDSLEYFPDPVELLSQIEPLERV